MYKLIILVLLGGCSLLNPKVYDPIEYDKVISIVMDSTHAIHTCDTRGALFDSYIYRLNMTASQLEEYSNNNKNSQQTVGATKNIHYMIIDITNNQKYSNTYCKHKLSNVQSSSRTLSLVLGNKGNSEMCSVTAHRRYALFEFSYKQNKISLVEFNNLVEDLLKLAEVDAFSCSLSDQQKLQEALSFIKTAASVIVAFNN